MPIYMEISRLHRCVTIVARGQLMPDEIMGAAKQLFEAQVHEMVAEVLRVRLHPAVFPNFTDGIASRPHRGEGIVAIPIGDHFFGDGTVEIGNAAENDSPVLQTFLSQIPCCAGVGVMELRAADGARHDFVVPEVDAVVGFTGVENYAVE